MAETNCDFRREKAMIAVVASAVAEPVPRGPSLARYFETPQSWPGHVLRSGCSRMRRPARLCVAN